MTAKELLGTIARRPFLLAIMALAIAALNGPDANLTLFYLHRQDRWLLLAAALLLTLSVWKLPARKRPFAGGWQLAIAVGALMAVAAYVGHYLLLSGYDLSRDEQMATFDAGVFAQGRLVAPLPDFWRGDADALNQMFMYPTSEPKAWISSYLPLNAALRVLFGWLGDPALTGPAMLLVGAIALWGCARRIWPDSREAAVVALVLYAGSGQVLFNAMTAYAMPAHLTLNLCWLWLFLRRTIWGDAGALTFAFVAVGLHQPVFHPMFAAPILFLLLLERDWRRAAVYFLGYAAIGAFWATWPGFIWSLIEADPMARATESVGFLGRLASTLAQGDAMRVANMVSNLLRFFAWQHLLLLPLLSIGIVIGRRDRLAAALAGGIGLTILVMLIVLPYQGHGFGYRYLHGVIGNVILLAVFGWMSFDSARAMWRGLLVRATIMALFIVIPLQAWMAHAFYTPPARVSDQIARSNADYALVGAADAPFAIDLVVNGPDLDNRPIRLLREALGADAINAICTSRPAVAIVGAATLAPITDYFGAQPVRDDHLDREVAKTLRSAGCRIVEISD